MKMKRAFTRVFSEVEFNWPFSSVIFGQFNHVNLHKPRTEQKCNPYLKNKRIESGGPPSCGGCRARRHRLRYR